MAMTDRDVDGAIRSFLERRLAVDGREIDPHAALVTSGLIDSADLVRLAVVLESVAGVSIPDKDIHADHFDSIAKMKAYLQGRAAR